MRPTTCSPRRRWRRAWTAAPRWLRPRIVMRISWCPTRSRCWRRRPEVSRRRGSAWRRSSSATGCCPSRWSISSRCGEPLRQAARRGRDRRQDRGRAAARVQGTLERLITHADELRPRQAAAVRDPNVQLFRRIAQMDVSAPAACRPMPASTAPAAPPLPARSALRRWPSGSSRARRSQRRLSATAVTKPSRKPMSIRSHRQWRLTPPPRARNE